MEQIRNNIVSGAHSIAKYATKKKYQLEAVLFGYFQHKLKNQSIVCGYCLHWSKYLLANIEEQLTEPLTNTIWKHDNVIRFLIV
jgi:hypothetical protein